MPMHMGDVIRQARERAGLTMGQLARKANVDIASISRIEGHKQHLLSQENLAKVAQALGTTATELERQTGANSYRPAGWPTLKELLAADVNLTERQRQAILAVYRAYVER